MPPKDSQDTSTPTVGRTSWDFATETARQLGPGILLLIGIGIAVYMFMQQEREYQLERSKIVDAAEEARRAAVGESQAMLRSANARLIGTYETLGKMNTSMLESVDAAMKVLDSLQKKIGTFRQQSEAESRKVQSAIAEQLRAEQARLKAEEDLKTVRAKAQEERRKAERESKERQLQRAIRAGPFREEVAKLVEAIRTGDESEDISVVAEKIRSEFLVDAKVLLTAWVEKPTVQNAKPLQDLEGLAEKSLLAVARAGAPFERWISIRRKREGASPLYLAVKGLREDGFDRAVLLEIDRGRVVDVNALSDVHLRTAPDDRDFDRRRILAWSIDADGDFQSHFSDMPEPGVTGPMDLSEFLAITGEYPTDKYEYTSIFGESSRVIRLVPIEQGPEKLPAALENDEPEFVNLIRRVKAFNASELVPELGAGRADVRGLQQAVIAALTAAVARDESARKSVASPGFPRTEWGYLATNVLAPNVMFEPVVRVAEGGGEMIVEFAGRDPESSIRRMSRLSYQRIENAWKLTDFDSFDLDRSAPMIEQMPERSSRRNDREQR